MLIIKVLKLLPDHPMSLEWGGAQESVFHSFLGQGTAGHIPAWKDVPGSLAPYCHSLPHGVLHLGTRLGPGVSQAREEGRSQSALNRCAEVKFLAVEPVSSFLINLSNKTGPF